MSAYNPNSQFSRGALCRLEAAGIPIVTSLEKVDEKLAAAIGIQNTRKVLVLEKWASGTFPSTHPPTWRTYALFEVMRELNLEELSQEIEEYLSCEW